MNEVLALCEISTRPRKVKEGFVKVETVLKVPEALMWSGKVLIFIHLTETVVVRPFFLIGQDLCEVKQFTMLNTDVHAP